MPVTAIIPPAMRRSLDATGHQHRELPPQPHAGRATRPWPRWGLCRIQWEGPWTRPGVPARTRYRFTHWVGAAVDTGGVGIFDVNVLANGSGWCSLENW